MPRWRWIPPDKRGKDGKAWVEVDGISKDPNHGLNGPVGCPEGGYFDPVLNRRFENKEEKRAYLRANHLQMHSGNKKQTEGNPGKTYYFIPGLKANRYYKLR